MFARWLRRPGQDPDKAGGRQVTLIVRARLWQLYAPKRQLEDDQEQKYVFSMCKTERLGLKPSIFLRINSSI